MASPVNVKTEERLYTISPEIPVDWTPLADYSVPRIATPQAFVPFYSEVPVAKVVRESHKLEQQPFTFEKCELFVSSSTPGRDSSACRSPSTLSNGHLLSPALCDIPSTIKRIPRPPNAFMLFRSDFLKKGHIPKDVEKRQQNLSRIVGQVWTMMEDEEKQKWHQRAHEISQKHQLENPDYKFVPAPRGSRRAGKDKAHTDEDSTVKAEARTQRIREMYTGILGPSPPSARKRRPKKARSVEAPSPFPQFSIPNAALSVYTPRSSPSANSMRRAQMPSSTPICAQEPFFTPLHVPRRPSTSLGFIEHSKQDSSVPQGPLTSDISTSSKMATEFSMFEYVHVRGQNITTADTWSSGQPSTSTSVPATATFDTSQWASYSMAATSPQIEAKIQSPIHPQLARPFSQPSSVLSSVRHSESISPLELALEPEIAIPAPTATKPSNSTLLAHVDDDDAFFASFGFSDDMLLYLKAPLDGQAASTPGVEDEWLYPEPDELAKWEFENLYSAQQTGSQITFTTGNLDSSL